MKEDNHLSHITWKCKYHIVFAPKYRHQIIYGKYKQSIGYLKGKRSLKIFYRQANLKYRYGNRKFLFRGYYVDIVGRNKK